MRNIRFGIAQINSTVGDLGGNTRKIVEFIDQAKSLSVDLVTFPELAISGYPPEDLLLKPQFVKQNRECLDTIMEYSSDIAVVVGFVDSDADIYNAAALLYDKKLVGIYHKFYLPNYGVFDENRYFQAGKECPIFIIHGIGIGITICEDIWYETGPATVQAYAGARLLVNISASPYHAGKGLSRERMLATRAADNVAIVVYNNLVGGQDELVFDGNSVVFNEKGEPVGRGKQFEEDLVVVDLDTESVFRSQLHDPRRRKETPWVKKELGRVVKFEVPHGGPVAAKPPLPARQLEKLSDVAEIYQALVLGVRDYVRKNGFEKVVIGLSGGVDSSLVAVIATDALGSENVIGVSMPSRYSSSGSKSDAEALARNLGIDFRVIPIEKTFGSYLETLTESFKDAQPDTTEENIQARIRGNILFALSNKFGWLVLACSNKSETATGYTTIYGDMAGGFIPLKDVPKTMVYKLAQYRNQKGEKKELMPVGVLTKAPSAELRPNQRDIDTLPPYDILDPILKAYVEDDLAIDQIVAMGFDRATVVRVARLVDRSEYKRRQSAPGIKITPRDFGRDRRLPITNQFREG
ncbi:MAG: NAD+ synthase [Dehalococcoidia bacterium]|nr:NAD+ synthase [Dehalococcoidia bacterium]MDH4300061.1 NAD+ synthase [Dehalococcoidia bacterium]MDH4366943.1 NAD+ synthase [Dehalococcoidia bacterium]